MQVGQLLRPRLNHVNPYTLKYGQLYVSDTYTNFVRSVLKKKMSVARMGADLQSES